jgi:hypothetical protein
MHPLVNHNGQLYLYYCGCQGLHNDYMSTEPTERMRQAKFPEWPHYWQPLSLGKDTYSPVAGLLWFSGAIGRASWETGRLWAAVTAGGGDTTGDMLTRAPVSRGKQLSVNVVTVGDGTLSVELISAGQPIPGFSRSDCTPIVGNHHSGVVQWKAGTRIPADNVQVRFYLHRARLYGFDVQDGK